MYEVGSIELDSLLGGERVLRTGGGADKISDCDAEL